MFQFNGIVDRQVQKAQRDGTLDGLKGAGKPLDISDTDNSIDGVTTRFVQQSRALPHEMTLQARINHAWQELKTLETAEDRKAKMKEIADMQTQLGVQMDLLKRGR